MGVLLMSGLLLPAYGADRAVLRLASLEWPPYTSQSLPEDGMASAMISAVLQRVGQRARFDYFPWKRAVLAGSDDPQYAGYMPTWRTPEREAHCYFSTPIARTSTVLAYLKGEPHPFNTLADLAGMRVGVVAGYAYGGGFDTRVARGQFGVEEGLSDEENLRKLLVGRMRVVLIEKQVLTYLLASGKFSLDQRRRIVSADQVINERPVAVCFQRTPRGLTLQQAFDTAAKGFDLSQFEQAYLKKLARPAADDVGRAGISRAR